MDKGKKPKTKREKLIEYSEFLEKYSRGEIKISVRKSASVGKLLLTLPGGLSVPKDGLILNFFSWLSVILFICAVIFLFIYWKLSIILFPLGYLLYRLGVRHAHRRIIYLMTSDEIYLLYFSDAIKRGTIIIDDSKGNVYVVHGGNGPSDRIKLKIQTKSESLAMIREQLATG